jgi:hypothetical protein
MWRRVVVRWKCPQLSDHATGHCRARAAAPSRGLARVEQPHRRWRLLTPVRSRRAALCIHRWRWPRHHCAHRARAVQHRLDGQVSRPERARTAAGQHAGGLSHPRALPRAAATSRPARWQHGPGGRQCTHSRRDRAVAITHEPHPVAGRDGRQPDLRGGVRPRDAPAARGRTRLRHADRPRGQGAHAVCARGVCTRRVHAACACAVRAVFAPTVHGVCRLVSHPSSSVPRARAR